MNTIKVMVNGLPGNIARSVAGYLITDDRFELVPYSLTGPEIQKSECIIDNIPVKLIQADQRNSQIEQIKQSVGEFLSVDYTHPSAVNSNAEFYCRYGLPFVMGTTGGDRQKLETTVAAVFHCRSNCTQHGQTNCRLPGYDGICRRQFPGLVQGLFSINQRKSSTGQGRHQRYGQSHGRLFQQAGCLFFSR